MSNKQMNSKGEEERNYRSIWALSWVCFFWGIASVMVLSLLPTFLSDELKVSKVSIGYIEGMAILNKITKTPTIHNGM